MILTATFLFAQSSFKKFNIASTDTFYLEGSFNNWQPILMESCCGEPYEATYTFHSPQFNKLYEWKVVRKDGAEKYPQSANAWVYPSRKNPNIDGDSLIVLFTFLRKNYNDDWYPKQNILRCNDYMENSGINYPNLRTDEGTVVKLWSGGSFPPGGDNDLSKKANFVGCILMKYPSSFHWLYLSHPDWVGGYWGKENRLVNSQADQIPFSTNESKQVVYCYFDGYDERLTYYVAPRTLLMKFSPEEAEIFQWISPYSNDGYYSEGYTGWKQDTTVQIKAGSCCTTEWKFYEWSGDAKGTANPMNIVMDKDKIITANFRPVMSWTFSPSDSTNHCPPDKGEMLSMGTLKLTAGGTNWTLNKLEFTAEEKVKAENTEAKLRYNNKEISGIISTQNGNIQSIVFNLLDNPTIEVGQSLSAEFLYKFNFPSKCEDKYLSGALNEVKKYKISIAENQIFAEPNLDSLKSGFIEPTEKAFSKTHIFASVWNVSRNPEMPFASIQEAVSSTQTKENDKIKVCPGCYAEKVTVKKPLIIYSSGGADSTLIKLLNPLENTLTVESNDVKISGFSFENCANAINIDDNGKTVSGCEIVENVLKDGFLRINKGDSNYVHKNILASGVFIRGNKNRIDSNRVVPIDRTNFLKNGIVIMDSSAQNRISHNVIGGANNAGILLKGENVILTEILDNIIGVKEGEGATNKKGIFTDRSSNNHIARNFISGNNYGVSLENSSNRNTVEFNVIGEINPQSNYKNLTGIEISRKCSENKISNNTISMNFTGIYLAGRTNKIDSNLIGTDISGAKMVENQRGILIAEGARQNIVTENIISGNGYAGIWLKGKGVRENSIEKNLIGINKDQNAALPNQIGIKVSNGAGKNTIAGNVIAGNNCGILLQNVGTNYNSVFHNIFGVNLARILPIPNNKGILLDRCFFNNVSVNEILFNKTGIFEIGGLNFFNGNNIENNSGETGIHSTNFSKSVITGNRITKDKTNGIRCDFSASPLINENNIFDNTSYGLFNSDDRFQIDARYNYWGTSSEPTDTVIFGNADFSNWYADPLAFVSSMNRDTVFFPAGMQDSFYVFYENLIHRFDEFRITLSDEKGWLVNSFTFTDSAGGFLGAPAKLKLRIPEGTPENTTDKIFLNGKSVKENSTREDTVVVLIYTPKLKHIKVMPDSLVISPQDSVRFGALGFDQYNHLTEVEPIWNASAGTIDTTGLFMPQGKTGAITITVNNKSGSVSATAIIVVDTSAIALTSIKIFPDSVILKPGSLFLFRAKGYNKFNFPQPFKALWSSTGGTIDNIGFYTADTLVGNFTVTVKDTASKISQTAKVIISKLTRVNSKASIPKKFSLAQNYPNPFNPSTNIQYSLPYTSKVTLEIFNVLGQRVNLLVNRIEKPGIKRITWNAGEFASGVYFVRVIAVSLNNRKVFTATRKLVLIK